MVTRTIFSFCSLFEGQDRRQILQISTGVFRRFIIHQVYHRHLKRRKQVLKWGMSMFLPLFSGAAMPLEWWQRQASPTTRFWILREGAATFDVCQLFLRDFAGDTSAIEGRSEDFRDVLIGKCFAEPALAHEPAEPYNRFRDIKLGSIKSVSALKLRAAPFSSLCLG